MRQIGLERDVARNTSYWCADEFCVDGACYCASTTIGTKEIACMNLVCLPSETVLDGANRNICFALYAGESGGKADLKAMVDCVFDEEGLEY